MAEKLVIVGGGPAATNAIETIRRFDSAAEITLVSDEPAHSRMALPYWLAGQIPEAQTHTGDAAYFQKLNVQALIGDRVAVLNESQSTLELDSGRSISYDQLLLATGSTPLPLPVPGADLPGVQPLWTLAQTASVLQAAEQHASPRVALIGGGFIGLIVMNAMHKRGWQLTVIEQEAQILPRMLNSAASQHANGWLTSRGIKLCCGASVQEITAADNGEKRVVLSDGENIPADIVIVATGVQPNLSLVADTSVAVDHGILIDDQMRTSVANIYAAGDVAQGPVRFSDQREVHAIQPTAVDHGRVAGANMAGHTTRYPGSLVMNVLDVCGLQCASFGNWQDEEADAFVIDNPRESIFRSILWKNDQITGAVFVGQANNMGMLTDVGMVKGLIQTATNCGPWKDYLRNNPFDIRRAFVACDVPRRLMAETLLGQPATARQFRFRDAAAQHQTGEAHQVYVRHSES